MKGTLRFSVFFFESLAFFRPGLYNETVAGIRTAANRTDETEGGNAMPLYLVRQDLTKMDCDAIVSPSNPKLHPGGGLDAAIHHAAGPQLLECCRALGGCPVGEARVAPAFDLPCRWVIVTAGPVWRGGWFGERKKLMRCYRSCVSAAAQHGCSSLAIPLIGAGNNKIPLTQVLSVAVETLEDCLRQSDMTVYLVVFDKSAFALSKQLRADVQSFIDDNYAAMHRMPDSRTMCMRTSDSAFEPLAGDAGFPEEASVTFDSGRLAGDSAAGMPGETEKRTVKRAPGRFEDRSFSKSAMCSPQFSAPATDLGLQVDEPFSLKLLRLIDQKGMDDVACYKKANVSRQTWYKIMNEPGYKPNKKTVLSFSVALELTLKETQMLLESVGFVLSKSSLFDVILMYCLSNGIYSVSTIDAILFQYDQETLYSKA